MAPDPPFAVQTVSINGTVGGAYNGFVCDGSGNVWFSDITDGQLIKFATASSTFTMYPGFNRPLAIAVSGTTVYVAENCRSQDSCSPAIAQMSTSGGPITRTQVIGSPYGIAVVSGSVVWSSSAEDVNRTQTICVLDGGCVATGEANFYLASDASGNIYFSFYGSNGVGVISGLEPSVSGNTTTTTTGSAASTGSSSTSSSKSASSTSSVTSSTSTTPASTSIASETSTTAAATTSSTIVSSTLTSSQASSSSLSISYLLLVIVVVGAGLSSVFVALRKNHH